jgi:hypothetical protein
LYISYVTFGFRLDIVMQWKDPKSVGRILWFKIKLKLFNRENESVL